MRRIDKGATPRFSGFVGVLLLIAIGGLTRAEGNVVKIIGDDRGGYIGARALEVAELNTNGARIELRGQVCLSSCTLYLGVEDVCVSPDTTFGFHGPSRNGRPLPGAQFDHWSNVMAQHYQPALQAWFMSDARHKTTGYSRISGRQLIEIGYDAC